jgi:hypothetical protein
MKYVETEGGGGGGRMEEVNLEEKITSEEKRTNKNGPKLEVVSLHSF